MLPSWRRTKSGPDGLLRDGLSFDSPSGTLPHPVRSPVEYAPAAVSESSRGGPGGEGRHGLSRDQHRDQSRDASRDHLRTVPHVRESTPHASRVSGMVSGAHPA